MPDPIDIALIGIGGYGNIYVSALLDALPAVGSRGVRLVGVADPKPAACQHIAELKALGVPVFAAPEAMLAATKPGLVVITSPIQFHHDHILLALSHNAHVLCEKPLCATVEQARSIQDAARRSRCHVAVGFQWSFGDATHALKNDIRRGVLGRPLRLRTLVLWPRDERYYTRNAWAGRIADAAGRPVNDSPVSNACAHFLHNMLYVLGETPARSALPSSVTAELYRSKPIENFDTAAVRCRTRDGTEIVLIVSHATRRSAGPVFEYEFENATVRYDEVSAPGGLGGTLGGHFVAHFHDGRVVDYGPPPGANEAGKLFATIDAIRSGLPGVCGVEAAIPHVTVTCAVQASGADVTDMPPSAVVSEGSTGSQASWVSGLDTVLERCYREGKLPSELNISWAAPGTEVTISEDLKLKVRRGTTPAAPAAAVG